MGNFPEWKVVTDFREYFDSPFVTTGGKNDNMVFYDLPLDASPYKDQKIIIYAKINSKIDDSFLISNVNGKEALADISKKIIKNRKIQYKEYYQIVCRLVDIVSATTVGGTQKPVALVEVDGVITDAEYKQFARYVAGHPDKFPPKRYLSIENISNGR